MLRLFWLVLAAVGLCGPAQAGELQFGYDEGAEGGQPALLVIPERAVEEMVVSIDLGGRSVDFERHGLAAGSTNRFEWKRVPGLREVTASMRVEFADGFVGQYTVPIALSVSEDLSVDLAGASADVEKRVLEVKVSAPVDSADIIAYGVGKEVLDQRTVEIGAGPGQIEIPWVGDPENVVILDVTLHNGGAWAGLTYSPWFLDIPHEDILFETDSDAIPADEAWKLEQTLVRLKDVVDKYGDLVPVKLYIAGCTDTVGDTSHNRELSRRRARAIGRWLRGHGFTRPIYFHGFGESLLAVPTGDGVDNAANRRALYMVGANPPPAGSGVPSVSWSAL